MGLLRYVDYIKEEIFKIQICLRAFPHNYRDNLVFQSTNSDRNHENGDT